MIAIFDDTFVIDTGESIIGIWSVKNSRYRAYRGKALSAMTHKILRVREVVTFNGNGERGDKSDLARFIGVSREYLMFSGMHVDMRDKCWPTMERGPSLINTFDKVFGKGSATAIYERFLLKYGDEYIADNRRDVELTRQLWKLWRDDKEEFRKKLDR